MGGDPFDLLIEALMARRLEQYSVSLDGRARATFSHALVDGALLFEEAVPDWPAGSSSKAAFFFALAYEAGWLAFAEWLRPILQSPQSRERGLDAALDILDAELAFRDAAARLRAGPAASSTDRPRAKSLRSELDGQNVIAFPGRENSPE